MIKFEPRFFPPRRYKTRLRWVLWGALVIMAFSLFLFLRLFVR